jgi:hypothetical protein
MPCNRGLGRVRSRELSRTPLIQELSILRPIASSGRGCTCFLSSRGIRASPHDALGMPVLRGVLDKGADAGDEGLRIVMARRPHGVRRDSVRRHFA